MNNQHQQQLNEGLRPNDLKHTVSGLFEVDAYRSKMGEDKDVCVLTFKVNDRSPAKDLMEFIEKGYNFVLDADVSSGENEQGNYFVFVELMRSKDLSEQIQQLTTGIKKLTDISQFQFKYYKNKSTHEVNEDSLKSIIPRTPNDYVSLLNKFKTEDVKRFFNKTLMDDLTLDGEVITIHKPFNNIIKLRMVKEAATDSILEGVTDTITMDEAATSEIFWLTKVLGDYNINKVGDKFMFDNNGQAMLLQRIEQ
jgi:hypothetical protein